MNYEPWDDRHAPKNFHRTDPTGRFHQLEVEPRINYLEVGMWLGSLGIVIVLLWMW